LDWSGRQKSRLQQSYVVFKYPSLGVSLFSPLGPVHRRGSDDRQATNRLGQCARGTVLGQFDLPPRLRSATAPNTNPSAAPIATHEPMLPVAEPIAAPTAMPITVDIPMFKVIPSCGGQIARYRSEDRVVSGLTPLDA